MPNYIKPTFTLTANKNSVATNKGPLSIGLSISTTDSLSVDKVRSEIIEAPTTGTRLLDGSTLTGVDTSTEGAGGTHGGYIYFKNISTEDTAKFIYIGVDHDGAAADQELQADDQSDNFTGATRLFTLRTGEFAWMPFDYTMDIYVDASHSGQTLEYWVFDRGPLT